MAKNQGNEGLEKIFAQAAEIAKAVPESMQEAAFHRALDALMGTGAPVSARAPRRSRSGAAPRRTNGSTKGIPNEKITGLINALNRTDYPLISAGHKVLVNALGVLQAAQGHDVNWLTPTEISQLLREKFRLSVSDAAVRMALGDAGKLVDRRREGSGYAYSIMQPGDEYLAAFEQGSKDSASKGTKEKAAKLS